MISNEATNSINDHALAGVRLMYEYHTINAIKILVSSSPETREIYFLSKFFLTGNLDMYTR